MTTLHDVLNLYTRLYDVPEHLRFHTQELVGSGAMGSVYHIDDNLVHKIEKVTATTSKDTRIFDSVEYMGKGVLRFDDITTELNESELNLTRSRAASYPAMSWMQENPYTQNLATKEFEASREFFQFGNDVYQRTVMEYEKGIELSKYGLLNPDQATHLLKIGARIISDLDDRCLVHRDIKPANIIYNEDGDFKLIDFSTLKVTPDCPLARTLSPDFQLLFTEESEVAGLGTPMFMDTNAFTGHADTASDIYSLGITVYMAVTNNHPFLPDSDLLTLRKMYHQQLARANPDDRRVLENDTHRNVETLKAQGVQSDIAKTIVQMYHPTKRARYEALDQALALNGSAMIAKPMQSNIRISYPGSSEFYQDQTVLERPLDVTLRMGLNKY